MFSQIFRVLIFFGIAVLMGCGAKESAPGATATTPEPVPSEAPAPPPAPPPPQPDGTLFSMRLAPRESPTQFTVNRYGEIRIVATPEVLAGRMERTRAQFGRLPLTEERCARIDRMSLDLLAFRDSPEFFRSFQIGFEHLRTSESVEFKVQLPILFRLGEDALTVQQIKLQALPLVDQSRFLGISSLKLVDLPSPTSSETQALVGASAWSNRLDGARLKAGQVVGESVRTRMWLEDVLEGSVAFSEVDFLCDVAAGRTTFETTMDTNVSSLSKVRVNWKLALGNAP